jgi:acyl-CoA thioester hydrolase
VEQYTIFTLETHICYLREANLDEPLTVHLQLLDYDEKRLHVFLVMKNAQGDRVATSEQMLMGMDVAAGRPGIFPDAIMSEIVTVARDQKTMDQPREVGRMIGIRRK